jgi:hypothetical protein
MCRRRPWATIRSTVRYEAKEKEHVLLEWPVRDEVTKMARPGLLELMRNHSPGHGGPEALLEVVDAYLRLNPQDDEVREGRERLMGAGERVGA